MGRAVRRSITAAPYGIRVTFTASRKTFERRVRCDTTGAAGMCSDVTAKGVYVGVFDRNPATLVHECVHAALAILSYVGIDVRNDRGEALAYMTDYLWSIGRCLCDLNTAHTAGR